MKNILIIIALVCFTTASNAQLGITGGLSFPNYSYKISGKKQDRVGIITYNVGLVYRTPGKIFCLQPAAEYSIKGSKNFDSPFGSGIDHYQTKLNYLQFSLPAVIKGTLVKGISIDFGAGPYLSTLLKGTRKIHYFNGDDKMSDYKIGTDSTSTFKRTDAGVTFLFGAKLSHIGFYFIYDLGISNITPIKDNVIKNRDFRINMSFYF